MLRVIDRLGAAVETRYKTTPATAAECFQQLHDGLMTIGMEPEWVSLYWQVLNTMTDDEKKWDTFSAEEKQQNKNLLKGKQRK